MPQAFRRLWLLLALAVCAVTYLAVTPGGPLSAEYRQAPVNTLWRIPATASAKLDLARLNAESLASELTDVARSGGDPIIGETIDRLLGLVSAGSSGHVLR